MNGALGYVRGYMWPEGGDPHAVDAHGLPDKKRRAPLCVFVELDGIKLQSKDGRPLSFLPDDPDQRLGAQLAPEGCIQ